MKKLALLTPLLAMLLLACNANTNTNDDQTTESYSDSETSSSSSSSSDMTDTSSDFDQTAMPEQGDTIAVISTRLGDITLRFFPEKAPKTVENFLTHSENGYYDGVIFHRVIDGFMIQGGDPQGTGMGGESIWGEKFEDEFDNDLKNIRGSISMANAGPNTNGSQFFINQVDNNFLDNRHSVFGQVISGMDVVDMIAKAEKSAGDKPLEDIEMAVEVMPYEG